MNIEDLTDEQKKKMWWTFLFRCTILLIFEVIFFTSTVYVAMLLGYLAYSNLDPFAGIISACWPWFMTYGRPYEKLKGWIKRSFDVEK